VEENSLKIRLSWAQLATGSMQMSQGKRIPEVFISFKKRVRGLVWPRLEARPGPDFAVTP